MWLPCCRMSLGGTAEGLGGEEVRVYIHTCVHASCRYTLISLFSIVSLA